jgi:hypothetical protein
LTTAWKLPLPLVVVPLDDYSLVCLLLWCKEPSRFPPLFDPDRVSSPHRPALKHRGINTYIDLIVLSRGPQNTRISGQVTLG